MIITRKIEIFVHEEDKEKRKNYTNTVFKWRDAVRKAANLIVTHKFVQMNVRDFMYFQDDVREKFSVIDEKTGKKKVKLNVSDILVKGPGMSEQNTTYRLLSSQLKGIVPADIYSCLNQAIAKTFKETATAISKGDASLQCYKNNVPIPFSAKAIANIHKGDDNHFYFTLFGIPFECKLGRDRSNNEAFINNCISGNYNVCSSSIAFQKSINKETGKKKQKLFLFLCANVPHRETQLDPNKVLYAYLGVETPITYNCEIKAKNEYDSGVRWFTIGTKEEFLYRRVQIQNALRRCQINNRYAGGGKGRKRKCQAISRFHEKEINYVHTKLHTYSRILVDAAAKNHCGTIFLVNQAEREASAKDASSKGNYFILRNWSYFGLKTKIEYKAKMLGIKMVMPTKELNDEL